MIKKLQVKFLILLIKSLILTSEISSVITLRFSEVNSIFFKDLSMELELSDINECRFSVVSLRDIERFLKFLILSWIEFLVSLSNTL